MAQNQGRISKLEKRKKVKAELGSDSVRPKVSSKEERKSVRVLGGKEKTVAITVQFANVSVGGKTQKVKINTVEENPADKDFKRENILSLGGIVDTELGKAKITSRPSQDGIVNAILVK